ncbi:universal stress protein [Aquimarina sp. MMG016]|uniref:universal stress protein n=1 Tax=Aquimarina sp. MMG016 TaxID=2822690 RepID=UPI001B3A30B0|nr:universal stress protein [Aquimarina sp. MMG016]MBQ4819298.1 universal stress protein [Aquimarina sp. MMG016]
MNSKKSKYHLLVLMDLSKASEAALKNAVHLAKEINGKVEVFHVKSPADVAKYENQFSAMRAIQEDTSNVQSKLMKLIREIEKEEKVVITLQISYGNAKQAIKDKIDSVKPDLVILGKRKNNLMNFLEPDITKFVLKECNANILISGEDNKFHSFDDISLGVYGETIHKEGLEIISDLKTNEEDPIRFFRIRNPNNSDKSVTTEQNKKWAVSYTFSEGENALDGLASYITGTNTQLFCIPRKQNENASWFGLSRINDLIYKLNIPVLILR